MSAEEHTMKILVTGAAGFVGSHVSEILLNRGDDVVGLDNFNDYYDPTKKRKNEKQLNQYENFKMIEADVRERDRLFEICETEKFDGIIHLAAMAGVRNAVRFPALYVDVDLNGTQHLMDAARAVGNVDNFVFACTSSVYGNTKQIPFVETDPCDRPLQPYAAAKRAAEMLGHAYHHLFGMNFTSLRFFTVYGPRNRPDMMAYLVAESTTKGVQIPLYNDGEMFRDWTFVHDIATGVVQALDNPLGYEVLNLGRGQTTKLKDFVKLIESHAGNKANVISKPKLAADFIKNLADISKAKRLIGYNPQVSIEEGVAHFWEWYINQ
jgi:UDP-glucuronate 4-epimerase